MMANGNYTDGQCKEIPNRIPNGADVPKDLIDHMGPRGYPEGGESPVGWLRICNPKYTRGSYGEWVKHGQNVARAPISSQE